MLWPGTVIIFRDGEERTLSCVPRCDRNQVGEEMKDLIEEYHFLFEEKLPDDVEQAWLFIP